MSPALSPPPSDRLSGCFLGQLLGNTLGHAIQARRLPLQALESAFQQDIPLPTLAASAELRFWDQLYTLYHEKDRWEQAELARCFRSAYANSNDPIGPQSLAALQMLREGEAPQQVSTRVWERSKHQAAGSGGSKRSLAVALFRFSDPVALDLESRAVAHLTHADPRCHDVAVALNRLLAALIQQRWDDHQHTIRHLVGIDSTIIQAIHTAVHLPLAGLVTSGFVITTFQAAYRIMQQSTDFGQAMLQTLTLGGQSATLGTLAGALLGARWGAKAIPASWLNAIPNNHDWTQQQQALLQRHFPQSLHTGPTDTAQ